MGVSSMKYLIPILALTLSLAACSDQQVGTPSSTEANPHDAFFQNLLDLCGQSFTGEATLPDDPEHELVGVPLRATIVSCEDDEIRIALHAGEDESRTWVITRSDEGMHLRHDHRYPDGTPHDLTDYGGWANDEGTATVQYFPADDLTATMLPEAATNVWMMQIDLENQRFVYYLERHALPRFRAELARE